MRAKLKNIASFSKGVQINGDELLPDGQYVFLNGGIRPSGQWNAYNVNGNTVTISEGGNSCGYVNFMEVPFWCGAHCYYLFDSKVDDKYLFYALKSQQDRIMQLRSGACMPNIKKNDLGEFEFFIDDDKDRQKLIVRIFDKVDGLIAKRQQQLAKLDELVKARFVEMFGDPIRNNLEFPTKPLGEICLLKAGAATPADVIFDYDAEHTIPCYGGNGIRGYVKESTQYGIYPIIGRQGALCGNVQLAQGGFHATEHAVLVTPRQKMNIYWIFYLLKYMDLYRYHTGAAQPGLAVKTLNTVEVPIADLALQDEFSVLIAKINGQRLTIQQSLDKLEVLKKSLMQEYFG